jgi:hypothetical protein
MGLVGEGLTPFTNALEGLLALNDCEDLSKELLLELELLPRLLLLKLLLFCWMALLWKKLLLLLVVLLLLLPKLLGFL